MSEKSYIIKYYRKIMKVYNPFKMIFDFLSLIIQTVELVLVVGFMAGLVYLYMEYGHLLDFLDKIPTG